MKEYVEWPWGVSSKIQPDFNVGGGSFFFGKGVSAEIGNFSGLSRSPIAKLNCKKLDWGQLASSSLKQHKSTPVSLPLFSSFQNPREDGNRMGLKRISKIRLILLRCRLLN